MVIYFGLALDFSAWPNALQTTGNQLSLGPSGLLQWLENHLGLSGLERSIDYLRIEQYRQALRMHWQNDPEVFYAAAFQADQFATATELLQRRDELLLANWNFDIQAGLPHRLATLAAIEKEIRQRTPPVASGFADRFLAVEHAVLQLRIPLLEVVCVEPLSLLPTYWQRLFTLLQSLGVRISEQKLPVSDASTDLQQFKNSLGQPSKSKPALKGDGSLLMLRGKRDTELAAYLASLFRNNPALFPCLLIPERSRTLDNALIQEGLPSLGIQPASLARPTLQILKLASVFLWYPIDPFKIMEFVSLPVKPLDGELANRIAQLMAQTPGLQGEFWHAMISQFFRELDNRSSGLAGSRPAEIRQQYRFWFERKRYDASGIAPKEEVTEIFNYLAFWARSVFRDNPGNPSLMILAEQARQIEELLLTLPERQLSRLELERIVRTIYEAAPAQMSVQEVGSFPYVHHPHAFKAGVDQLLWWNFIQNEPDYFFSRWYQGELEWLNGQGIKLTGPREQNALLSWQRRQPVLACQQQLILVIPEIVEGKAVNPHPLLGDLEACFGHLALITATIDNQLLGSFFALPDQVKLSHRQLGRPAPFLSVKNPEKLAQRQEETFSSLDSLLYYPYQWLFQHQIRLRKSSILSIVKDQTLMGNLAHRFFQQLLEEKDPLSWSKKELEQWTDREIAQLLQKEGAVLLMYGREPERVRFIKKLKYAAWSLLNHLQSNGWEIVGTEQPLIGKLENITLHARADLILQRNQEKAVLDLKWRGANYREQMIKNEEDLQLVLYSRLATSDGSWAHTAYFIMETGKLLARNNVAFREVSPILPNADHEEVHQRIWEKMCNTFQWRMEQVENGRIEVRCEQTRQQLEQAYEGQLLAVLEMKNGDATYDDYRTLINLVQ
jgi:hypothetical protein